MRHMLLLIAIVCFSLLLFGQTAGTVDNGRSAPGAYGAHPGPPGMDLPAPADRNPADVFMEDSKLVAKIQKLLPKDTTPQQACDGFKKLIDCVAAIHTSQNLEIPLAELKAKVTGKNPEKLENAIHELKPNVDAKAEKKKAWKQADHDIPVSN